MSYRVNGTKYFKVELHEKFTDYLQKKIMEKQYLYDEIYDREHENINDWYNHSKKTRK